MQSPIIQKLLDWYAKHQRDFPWRQFPDPYPVWVSEIMAQQTRLDTMLPYFQRWMERFPSISALAQASQQEVAAAYEESDFIPQDEGFDQMSLSDGAHL